MNAEVIIDGRPSPPRAYRNEAEMRAALTIVLQDGIDCIRRCRVGKDALYLQGTLTEFACICMEEWCRFAGLEPPEDWRREAERVIGEGVS